MMRSEDDEYGIHYRTIDLGRNKEMQPNMMAPKPKRWLSPGKIVLFSIVGVIFLCVGFGMLVSAGQPNTPAQVTAIATGEAVVGAVATPAIAGKVTVAPVPAAPKPVVITGKNVAAAPIGAKLNGPFTVKYAFGSWCGIVNFLKADGSDGANFMEGINDCSGDTNSKLAGSTVVHLKDVTMVKVDNTKGSWTLTFTPIG